MTARKAISDKMKWQSLIFWNEIRCPECAIFLNETDEIEWDHRHAIVFDGPHEYTNIMPMHEACHTKKTIRDVKANAKIKRIQKGPKQPKGRKLQSRPFPAVHRPMRGR